MTCARPLSPTVALPTCPSPNQHRSVQSVRCTRIACHRPSSTLHMASSIKNSRIQATMYFQFEPLVLRPRELLRSFGKGHVGEYVDEKHVSTVASWCGSGHCSYDHDHTMFNMTQRAPENLSYQLSCSPRFPNACPARTPTAEHELTNSSLREHQVGSFFMFVVRPLCGGRLAATEHPLPLHHWSLVWSSCLPSPWRRLLASRRKPRNCRYQEQSQTCESAVSTKLLAPVAPERRHPW